jgi:hypothetical protein
VQAAEQTTTAQESEELALQETRALREQNALLREDAEAAAHLRTHANLLEKTLHDAMHRKSEVSTAQKERGDCEAIAW